MGGKSRSSQNTSNQQSTNNIVNDGQFAGVNGNVSVDESEHLVKDSYNTDNSQNTTVNDSFNQEYNIDNSQSFDGDLAGNSGVINVLDADAIANSFDFAKAALKANESVSNNAIDRTAHLAEATTKAAGNMLDSSLDFGSHSISAVQQASNNAIAASKHTVEEFSEFSADAFEQLAQNLAQTTQAQNAQAAQNVAAISAQAAQDKQTIAELARNTSLAGQDIVANQAGKMTLYMSVAVGVIGVAFIFAAAKRG